MPHPIDYSADFKMFTGLLKAVTGSDGKKRIKGVASSTTRDHHGDRMERTALKDMEEAANDNMTIFLNHSYMVPEDVVGSVEKAVLKRRGEDDDGNANYDLDVDIVVSERNERAIKAWESIDDGVKLGLSIGAMIPKGGATYDEANNAYIIHHVNLMETSVVSLPANPRSWISNAVKSLRSGGATVEGSAEAAYSGEGLSLRLSAGETVVQEIEGEIVATTTLEVETEETELVESVEDGTSQEAPAADPENEVAEAEPDVAADLDAEALDPVVRAAVAGVSAVLQTTVARLETTVDELSAEKQARKQAETQRDEAVASMGALVVQVKAIVDRIAQTPVGRKTSFQVEKDNLDHLSGVYDERFLKYLKSGETNR